jgi:hypothetical protein
VPSRLVLAAGVYDATGPGQHLLPGPVWTGLAVEPAPAGDRRVLDLRTGVIERTELTDDPCPLRTLRLASITIPRVVAMAAGRHDGMHWARTSAGTGAGIAAVPVQRARRDGAVRTVGRDPPPRGLGGLHRPPSSTVTGKRSFAAMLNEASRITVTCPASSTVRCAISSSRFSTSAELIIAASFDPAEGPRLPPAYPSRRPGLASSSSSWARLAASLAEWFPGSAIGLPSSPRASTSTASASASTRASSRRSPSSAFTARSDSDSVMNLRLPRRDAGQLESFVTSQVLRSPVADFSFGRCARLDSACKLVAYGGRPVRELSQGKATCRMPRKARHGHAARGQPGDPNGAASCVRRCAGLGASRAASRHLPDHRASRGR